MCDKRCGIGTTSGVFKNGGINFNEAMFVHEITGGLPKATTTNEALANLGVNVHVNIASTVTLFFVGEAIAARQWAESLS